MTAPLPTPAARSAASSSQACSNLPSPEDVAQMRERHVAWIGRPGYCECGEKSPCDAARLIALVDAAQYATALEDPALRRIAENARFGVGEVIDHVLRALGMGGVRQSAPVVSADDAWDAWYGHGLSDGQRSDGHVTPNPFREVRHDG